MKPHWANNAVYEYFDKFLTTSVLADDSFLSDHEDCLNLENINACITAFVDNPDTSSRTFDEKAQDQFKDSNLQVKLAFAHCIWLWCFAAGDMTKSGKKYAITRFLGQKNSEALKDVFVEGGIGSAGQWHKQNKPFEIAYALMLLKYIKKHLVPESENNLPKLKELIEQFCLALYYQDFDSIRGENERFKELSKKQIALHHIILHVCNPDKYEPITSNNHKERIVSTFYSLLNLDSPDSLWGDVDGSIFKIRENLAKLMNRSELTFYDKDVARAWNYHDSEWGVDTVELFEYKKAIIFYGPPGTSKTYSAERLAELLIAKQYFRNKDRVREFFEKKDKIIKNHTHTLQLHTNYGYEDFIAGIQLENHNTVAKQGWLLKLIDRIKDDKLPHVIILDEVNRVDLSRLFGELFSRIEYRNDPIKIAVGDFDIAIPDNLYFIGTMNEIDFSLERIDFALRRRFLWEFMGFDPSILRDILNEKNKIGLKQELLEDFISRCSAVNNKISSEPELGKKYQIGHTFFAEIVDVTATYKGINNRKRFTNLQEPARILWKISIRPMLEAYFGNMDEQTRVDKLKEFEKLFLNG